MHGVGERVSGCSVFFAALKPGHSLLRLAVLPSKFHLVCRQSEHFHDASRAGTGASAYLGSKSPMQLLGELVSEHPVVDALVVYVIGSHSAPQS